MIITILERHHIYVESSHVCGNREIHLEEVDAHETLVRAKSFEFVYISHIELEKLHYTFSEFVPGKLGVVQWILPFEEGDTLYVGELGVKSDWYDKVGHVNLENKNVLLLFRQLRMSLRKNLAIGITGVNTATGGRHFYKGIGFSEGAQKFFDRGGKLMQRAVPNLRFEISGENQGLIPMGRPSGKTRGHEGVTVHPRQRGTADEDRRRDL